MFMLMHCWQLDCRQNSPIWTEHYIMSSNSSPAVITFS
jgi:hypothetical protein